MPASKSKQTLVGCFLAILMSVLTSTNYAQYFSETYYGSRPAMLFGSVEVKNNTSYITGVTNASIPPYYQKGITARIDSAGIFSLLSVLSDTFPYKTEFYWNSLKQTYDGNFLVTGEKQDSLAKILLVKFDTSGRLLKYFEFTDSTLQIFLAFDVVELPNNDGYIIVCDAVNLSNAVRVMAIRIDVDGTLLNKKIYGAGSREYPYVIKPMLNGHYMIGAFSMKANINTPFWCKTWLIEVDSMGDMVRQWLDPDPKNRYPYSMQQTADSGWIIVRQHLAYDLSNFQAYNASIVKLDKNFHKEWEIDTGGINQEGMYDVEILPDGSYICAGANPVNITQDSSHVYGWIMKVSAIGEILWERTYLPDTRRGTWGYLYDIDVLPNGDFIACGEMRYTQNVGITPVQQGWLLRVDSNGCEIENCILSSPNPLTPEGGTAMRIQPNPATNFVQVETENEMLGAELRVYDVTGKLMLNKTVVEGKEAIDVSGLNSGMYVIIAEKQGRFARAKLVVE